MVTSYAQAYRSKHALQFELLIEKCALEWQKKGCCALGEFRYVKWGRGTGPISTIFDMRMAISHSYEGHQLDPSSPIPEGLSGEPIEDIVEAVREWFFHNFEDPAEHTPRDGGEYVYIWGGPYDTRDIIENIFADSLTDDEITQVIKDLERDGAEWVPADRRIQPPEDDDDEAPVPAPEELHAALLARIAEAEAAIQQAEPYLQKEAPPGIGHNNPPESIADEAPVTRAEFGSYALR